MEEKHANYSMGRLVERAEMDECILRKPLVNQPSPVQRWHTTEAAKEPFNHRRRWPINSAANSGTSVSALLGFTYVRVHLSFFLATSSKHRIRSSAVNNRSDQRHMRHWNANSNLRTCSWWKYSYPCIQGDSQGNDHHGSIAQEVVLR